jgi:hypothetical protein
MAEGNGQYNTERNRKYSLLVIEVGKINGFKDLPVWQKGIEISVEVYKHGG